MQDSDPDIRPTSDELLRFFTDLSNLCLLAETNDKEFDTIALYFARLTLIANPIYSIDIDFIERELIPSNDIKSFFTVLRKNNLKVAEKLLKEIQNLIEKDIKNTLQNIVAPQSTKNHGFFKFVNPTAGGFFTYLSSFCQPKRSK